VRARACVCQHVDMYACMRVHKCVCMRARALWRAEKRHRRQGNRDALMMGKDELRNPIDREKPKAQGKARYLGSTKGTRRIERADAATEARVRKNMHSLWIPPISAERDTTAAAPTPEPAPASAAAPAAALVVAVDEDDDDDEKDDNDNEGEEDEDEEEEDEKEDATAAVGEAVLVAIVMQLLPLMRLLLLTLPACTSSPWVSCSPPQQANEAAYNRLPKHAEEERGSCVQKVAT
jgi:hypothetical protein